MLRTLSLFKSLVLATSALCLPLWIAAQNSVTPGEFQVTDAGASSYTIPLYTAPAAGNLDVKLALQYNSQSGNGVFGVGWSLTGVSSITRCPRTIAEEGERVGVKNNATDIFCLDGQKLRAVAGAYGAAGSEYRTAIDSYSKIVANGQQGTGPLSFTVYTKSGSIMEFGTTDDSRLQHPVTGTARVWMVNQIRDRFHTATNNSAINFTYSKDTNLGEQLLREVRYNNGLLRLNYVARPTNDLIIKYDDGVQLGSTNSRVSKIEVFDEPVVSGARQLRAFKEYRMGYTQSTSTRRSLLSSVQECASSSVCLPAVAMGYQSVGAVAFSAGDVAAAGNNVLVVDSNGKGKQEVIANDPYKIFNLSWVFTGAGTGGVLFNPTANSSVITFDIDGDSKTDFQISFPKKDSYSYCSYKKLAGSQTTQASCDNSQYGAACFADLNGDGVSEELYYGLSGLGLHSPSYLTVKEALSNSTANRVLYLGSDLHNVSADDAINKLARCRAIDLDGDARAEIIVADKVLSYSNNQLQTHEPNLSTMMLGDFNGDGKTDAITQQWAAASLSYGNGKFDSLSLGPQVPMPIGNHQYKPITCTGDFNGDGRTDFVTVPFGVVHIMLSNGNGFTDVIVPNIAVSLGSIHCGDFNGDGLTDLYVGNENRYYYNTLPSAVDALVNVNNGLGYSHQVEYKPITDDSVYTKYANAVRPQVDLQTPIQVVSRTQSGNNTQGWNNTSYRYEGLKADLHRRGTLGFAKVTSTNETTLINVATVYRQDYPYIGLKAQQLKSKGAQTLDYSAYAYTARGYNAVGAYTAQSAQVITTAMGNQRYDLDNSFVDWEQDAYNIDGYGNPTVHTKSQLDASQAVTSRKTSTNIYTNTPATWLIGQLTSSSTRSENLRGLPATSAGSVFGASLQTGALSVGLSPSPLAAQRNNPGVLTASVTPTVLGGIGPYSHVWTKVTGSRIMPASTTATNASFSATMGWNENLNETAQLKVTDSKGAVATAQVALNFKTPPQLSLNISPAAPSGWRADPGTVYASASAAASGGTGGYIYNWAKLSGWRVGIINNFSPNPLFEVYVGWLENLTETVRVTVTDLSGNVASQDININFTTPAAPLTVSQLLVSVTNPYTFGNCPTTLYKVQAVPSGGVGPYNYQWSPTPYLVESAGSVVYADFSYVTLTVTDAAGNVASVSNWYIPAQCDPGGSN